MHFPDIVVISEMIQKNNKYWEAFVGNGPKSFFSFLSHSPLNISTNDGQC